MKDLPRQVTVHYHRVGKPTVDYVQGLIDQNDERLLTYSRIPPDGSANLTRLFLRNGWIVPPQTVGAVRKHLFFKRHFTIVEFLAPNDALLGYYCDIALPMQKQDGAFSISDLMLDLWINPQRQYQVLDRDELEEALAAGLITPELAALAERVLAEMIAEFDAGVFPERYLD